MKTFWLLLCLVAFRASAQDTAGVNLKEYSESMPDDDANKDGPFLFAAVPYSGNFLSPTDHEGVLNLGNRERMLRVLNTYDSSDVYFFAPGIYMDNANKYEFRVLRDGKDTMLPWSPLLHFTPDSMEVGGFKSEHHYAFLGGFRTTWDHYLIIDLRRRGSDSLLSSSVVYWMPHKPVLENIYTSADISSLMTDVIRRITEPYYMFIDTAQLNKWAILYQGDRLDSLTHLPKKLILPPGENNIVFYINAGIFSSDALEYALLKDGDTVRPWHAGDFSRNFYCLANLTAGDYLLAVRFAAQRQSVMTYPFVIRKAWTQTVGFKVFIVGMILVIGFLIWFMVYQARRTSRERSRREKLGLELKSLRSQLNPHFIFNALSSIQSLINKNDISSANRYLSEFGTLLRETLKGSRQDFSPLHNEIQILDTYLHLEQLRFPFQYQIDVGADLPTHDIEIPALIFQPLVENAVKHGASSLQADGLIYIGFIRDNAGFTCIIRDNGMGFDTSRGSAGYGLVLTRERIEALNQDPSRSLHLGILSNAGSGTTITLRFENWLL